MAFLPSSSDVTRFYNGRIVQPEGMVLRDLWVQKGKFIDPQPSADQEINLNQSIVSPGYIDLQINGAVGFDFSKDAGCVDEVAKKLPKYGVTAFLPTLISLSPSDYRELLPHPSTLTPHLDLVPKILASIWKAHFLIPNSVGPTSKTIFNFRRKRP